MASRLMVAFVGGLSGDRNTSVHGQTIFGIVILGSTFATRYSYNVQDQRIVYLMSRIAWVLWWVSEQVGQRRQRPRFNRGTHLCMTDEC